ncbi:hypothetical protein C8J57DRAFT_1509119 [Mycena rebaudengoi]|nr:hypothetical protein C8J57DRAFT_1509119 [Mycena rebaudengoi]
MSSKDTVKLTDESKVLVGMVQGHWRLLSTCGPYKLLTSRFEGSDIFGDAARACRRHYGTTSPGSQLPSSSESESENEPHNEISPPSPIPLPSHSSYDENSMLIDLDDASDESPASLRHGSPMDVRDDSEEPPPSEPEVPLYYNVLVTEEDESESSEGRAGFDEVLDADAPFSLEEKISQLEQIIGPEDEAELWAMRASKLA